MKLQHLNDPAQVLLNHHTVIEASAGTGKTHTIIQLVLRLLIEEAIPLEKVLLVTFTEKATNELRERIREVITTALSEANDAKSHQLLTAAQRQVAQAPIYTINAFCQQMLREFAFEQGGVFDFELIDDRSVFAQVLQQMKREWPADASWRDRVEQLQQKSNQPDALLLKLAESIEDPKRQLKPIAQPLEPLCKHLFELVNQTSKGLLVEQFLGLKGSTAKTKQTQIASLEAWLDELNETSPVQIERLFSPAKLLPFKKVSNAFNEKNLAHNTELAPELITLRAAVDEISQTLEDAQFNTVIWQDLIIELRERVEHHKINRGLISYDDMINRLARKLEHEQTLPAQQQVLTRQLRRKFQVALIDEFQDTSKGQWSVFRHIFVNSSDDAHRLMVIGDPKQAIYGFRGADVETYNQAVQDLMSKHHAKGYRLTRNYRSLPDLLTGFNQFFGGEPTAVGAWWPAREVNVQAAPDHFISEQGPLIVRDDSGSKALNCFGSDGTGLNAENMRQAMADQIAAIIHHQLLEKVEIKTKGEHRTLGFDDICVLIHAASDAEPLEVALSQWGIPHHHHKKHSLYLSQEALQFEAVLTALAQPQDRKRVNNALVTVFFGLKPEQLEDFAEERLPQISEQWLLAKEALALGDWIRLFDVLLHHSNAASRVKTKQSVSNLNQIKSALCEMALSHNWDAKSLLQWLMKKRQADANHREDLQVKAVAKDAVNIMTMHVSKGLEFPVVFIYGGFGPHQNRHAYSKYRCPDSGEVVFDLNKKGKANVEKHKAHELAEKKRLYYVGMTRAVFKLFLPVSSREQHAGFERSTYAQLVNQRIAQLQESSGDEVIAEVTRWLDQTIEASPKPASTKHIKREPDPLPQRLAARNRRMYSFSGLAHQHQQQEQLDQAADKLLKNADLTGTIAAPVDWQQELPGGIKTGHVLHGIFEHVNFQWFQEATNLNSVWKHPEIMAVIDEQMQHHRLENGRILTPEGQIKRFYREELAAWVWHTLRKPLAALDGAMLADLPADHKRHEMSFFWQTEQVNLTGYIDLLFMIKRGQHRDYYILDWKSNHSQAGYAPDVLDQQIMKDHQYHWQYQLYGMAVQRWFDSMQLKNARLAGALYLFSRGINCAGDDQDGVYFDDFAASGFESIEVEKDLMKLVGVGK